MATDTTASTSRSRATERTARCGWLFGVGLFGVGLGLAHVAGCGGPPPAALPDSGPGSLLGSADNVVAFEGQHAFVTLVHTPIDVTGASVTLPPELDVREVRCTAMACAIVAEVLDTTPSTGTRIPAPIDAMVRQIVIDTEDQRVVATVNVMPLDQIEGVGAAASVQGTYFASSIEATSATTFSGVAGGEPIRWLVFGDVIIDGTVDVSAAEIVAGVGGFDGGAISGAASGQGAGLVGEGGGSGEAGLASGGGAGGEAWAAGCALDFFATECGGGGGGGDAVSAGGGGGGAFALVTLGTMTFDGSVVAHGADGAGGGGGGRVAVSAVAVDVRPVVDVAGGSGTDGADGGEGEQAASVESSLAEQLVSPRYILDTPSYLLDGTAEAGTVLRAESIDGAALGSAISGSDGSFSLELVLPVGLSRIRVFATGADGVERRLFLGNHVELERRSSRAQPQPVGGLIDVVYMLPMR